MMKHLCKASVCIFFLYVAFPFSLLSFSDTYYQLAPLLVYNARQPVSYGFSVNTLVQADRGCVPIENIVVGDFVKTQAGMQPVVSKKFFVGTGYIRIEHERGFFDLGFDQQVYIHNKGFVSAQAIQPGDMLCHNMKVTRSVYKDAYITMYCLCLPDGNYYVGDNILVHNFDIITSGACVVIGGIPLTLSAALAAGTVGVVYFAQKLFFQTPLAELEYEDLMQYPESHQYVYPLEVILQTRFYYERQRKELLYYYLELERWLHDVQGVQVPAKFGYKDVVHDFFCDTLYYTPPHMLSVQEELDLELDKRDALMHARDVDLAYLQECIADKEITLAVQLSLLCEKVQAVTEYMRHWDDAFAQQSQLFLHASTRTKAVASDFVFTCIGWQAAASKTIENLKYIHSLALLYQQLPTSHIIVQKTMLFSYAQEYGDQAVQLIERLENDGQRVERIFQDVCSYCSIHITECDLTSFYSQIQAECDRQMVDELVHMRARKRRGAQKQKKTFRQQQQDVLAESESKKKPSGGNKPPKKTSGTDEDMYASLKSLKDQADRKAKPHYTEMLYRDPKTKKWFTRDTALHNVRFKEYKAGARGFNWVRDLDAWGRDIIDKHKSSRYKFIPYKDVVFY